MDIREAVLESVVNSRLESLTRVIDRRSVHSHDDVSSRVSAALRDSLLAQFGAWSYEELESYRGWQVSAVNEKICAALQDGRIEGEDQIASILSADERSLWWKQLGSEVGQKKLIIDQAIQAQVRALFDDLIVDAQ